MEELSGTVSALGERRASAAAEAEEEERRVLEARRLRSSLRKGLHDAQKRVDGAGHRSRASLGQLQRLLVSANSFVEEEALAGAASASWGALGGEADPPPATADAGRLLRAASGTADAAAAAAGLPDWDDCASMLSDRYSVAGDSAAGSAAPPGGLLGQLLHFARSVLRLRFVVSLNEVSLTIQPGPRRRRGSRRRAARAARPRTTLREIEEQPDAAASDGDGPASLRPSSDGVRIPAAAVVATVDTSAAAAAKGRSRSAARAAAVAVEERLPSAAAGRPRAVASLGEMRPTRPAPPPPLGAVPAAAAASNRFARLVSVAGLDPATAC